MRFAQISQVSAAFALLCLAACTGGSKGPRPIAEAYVGPALVHVRSDIPLNSNTVATVKHGDKLEIVQRRRKFLRVRTASGVLGWVDERQLLAASDMAELRGLAERAAKLPSQGQATTFAELNVHTQPARQSPSFIRLKENDKVDVLARIVAPRAAEARSTPLIPPTPKKQAAPKKPKVAPKYPPPPMPKPPGPPANWLELSKTNLDDDDEADEGEEAKPVPMDDWTLVRTHTGQSGWVLTSRLFMAIPDEVAQYAEGHRIVSYFALGETRDGDQRKSTWLWTTSATGRDPWDFDGFRIFMWNARRHRYETAYIQRNLRGHLPVLVSNVNTSAGTAAFSLCLESPTGELRRREYTLTGNMVRQTGESACQLPPPLTTGNAPSAAPLPSPAPDEKPGFADQLKGRIKAMFGKKNSATTQSR